MSFERILIANRGEIACRIARTVRRMGISVAAIHSEADEGAPHVRMADAAVCVGPPPSAESYLDIGAVVEAARSTGADAVHPGFGFLSENAEFVEALARAGIAFIGPPPAAIRAMGDKIESRRLAAAAGVNTVPGVDRALADVDEAVTVAREIGYPVMLKASAGGGGKGMRIAAGENEGRAGFRGATNEAVASFGDGRIFVERYVERPRHIEIQVLADRHGTVLHLGERECSVQRRHQKVLEEAPSPFVDEAMRERMGAQAVALARAAGYVSAGTVEFIVDPERRFYFLEMNTRLQVEHPVTEAVTGLDLVEWMIRVAAGEALPFAQDDVRMMGWAMEARVYAEDPERDFLPATGRLLRYRPPRPGPDPGAGAAGAEETPGGVTPDDGPSTPGAGVRVDDGVEEGGEIAVWYDPMIAKLVTTGRDRGEALDRLETALDRYTVRGVTTNLAFLAALARHSAFRAGDLSTAFIDEHFPDGFEAARVAPPEPAHPVVVAAWMRQEIDRLNAAVGSPSGAGARAGGADGAGAIPSGAEREYVVLVGSGAAAGEEDRHERAHPVSLRRGAGRVVEVEVGEERTRYRVESDWRPGLDCFEGTLNGVAIAAQVERRGHGFRLTHAGHCDVYLVLRRRAAALRALMPVKRPPDLSRFLLSPMPGLLVRVSAGPGDAVKAGQELAVVEAMKMENVLRAEQDGTVAAVLAEPGSSLAVDQPILEFEAP
ncbi:MAG: ATP-grasp domain-containing protein [Immundisolibacterales bacterium]|nr:ATP-grasp domain-containing protein [Immundisolibacterales bacterium]